MIRRDFKEDLSKLNIKKEIPEKKKKEKEFEPLKRILIIGPDYPERCHFSENIYDLWSQMEGYEVKILGDNKLPVKPIHLEKGLELHVSNLLEKDWKPQLIIIDQISLEFTNLQPIPVFYHHREFKRIPTVHFPTVVYFWHKDIIEYYEKRFVKKWMAQVPYKEVMGIPYNPTLYKPEDKIYKGVNGIGFREDPIDCLEDIDIFEAGPITILQQELDVFKALGFNVFDTPITDEQYREYLPKCEALWIPLSIRQYISRRMIEAMGCKTLCVIKLENKRHEKILQKMGFINGTHYLGVKRLEDIKEAYNKLKNKKEMIEKAYNVVINNHTYQNRIEQIIKKYEEITNKNL